MTLRDWERKFGNKKTLHGCYTSFDMSGRVLAKDIFVNGRLVLRIEPIKRQGYEKT